MTEDEIREAAKALYNEERRIGWDPAWVNAGAAVQRSYESRVQEKG